MRSATSDDCPAGKMLPANDPIYRLLRGQRYHREFAPGCGRGTIVLPDGGRVEGRHEAAWPYELWRQIDANHATRAIQSRYLGSSPTDKRLPFVGTLWCIACTNEMTTHHMHTTHDGRTYAYAYYLCGREQLLLRRGERCRDERGGHKIRATSIEHQFQQLLDLLAGQSSDVAERIRAFYRDLTLPEIDPVAEYERKRGELDAQRRRVLEQHRKGYLSDRELDEAMFALRRDEVLLSPPPAEDHNRLDHGLQTAEELVAMGQSWRRAVANGQRPQQREFVQTLVQPMGLLYDPSLRTLIGVRPKPRYFRAMQIMLAPMGWAVEDGTIWNRHPDAIAALPRQNLFCRIMLLLKERPATRAEIAEQLAVSFGSLAHPLWLMVRQKVVARERIGNDRYHSYKWIAGDYAPRDAFRSWNYHPERQERLVADID